MYLRIEVRPTLWQRQRLQQWRRLLYVECRLAQYPSPARHRHHDLLCLATSTSMVYTGLVWIPFPGQYGEPYQPISASNIGSGTEP